MEFISGIILAGVIIFVWAVSPMKWPFTDERVERWKNERAAEIADHQRRVEEFKADPPAAPSPPARPAPRRRYW